MTTGLSRIDDLIAKMRGVFEADAPPADAPAETPPVEPAKDDDEGKEKTENKLSGDAQEFISKKISKLDKEGYPQKQAIAIAYSMARKAGYEVPAAPKEDDAPEKQEAFASSYDATPAQEKKQKELEKKGYRFDQWVNPEYATGHEKQGQMLMRKGRETTLIGPEGDVAEAEKTKIEIPAMQPRKDAPKDEYMEAFGVSKGALLAAKEELKTYSDFLAKYRDGDINAFESAVSENDSDLSVRCKSRPPQSWFAEAIRLISQDESVNDPAELAAWLWTHWVPKASRAKIAGQ